MKENKTFDCEILWQYVRLKVLIPKKYIWKFMKAFGEAFAVNDAMGDLGKQIKTVDNYENWRDGWHITVTFLEDDEDKFYQFFHSFCRKNKLTFKGSEKEEFDVNFLKYNKLRSQPNWFDKNQGKYAVFVNGKLAACEISAEEATQKAIKKFGLSHRFTTQVKSQKEEEAVLIL